jgi:hypothetical protein
LLSDNPAAATLAVIGAVEGEIVVREHITWTPVDEPFVLDDKQLTLREDGSSVWAWDRNSAHPDGFGMILGRFVAYLREASAIDLAPVVDTLFEKNRVALLWARLLMVGAERPDVLADKLWGLATNERIMLSSSVGHDAIEAVAAFYPSRSPEERRTFELAAFEFGADDPIHKSIHEEWLAILFQAIGLEQLATEEAREFLSSEKGSKPSPNARFEITSSMMEMTQRQILSEAGVLVDEPANDPRHLRRSGVSFTGNIGEARQSKSQREFVPNRIFVIHVEDVGTHHGANHEEVLEQRIQMSIQCSGALRMLHR